MRRRTVLGAITAFTTGCVSVPAASTPATTTVRDAEYQVTDLAVNSTPADAPIEFDAATTDPNVAPTDPATLELSLTNTGSHPQELFTGTVPPFGLVSADAVDHAETFLLWRPYEQEGCINIGEDRIVRCDIGHITTLLPGEGVTRAYDVLPSTTDHHPSHTVPPGPGRYQVSTDVSYSRGGDAPSTTLSGTVAFTLETPD